ncbi:hypothetical protein BV898_16255 [Hypsibius exemplaris]|uniref:Uncharacterized protein n=1 Tax=Hypsibius exemplaris TaxID=2072580 RepID=A0A9X6NLM4_HYPEX|nr:hypothetical protein BV898_16255 [Hypsibius exemplaris]
MAHVTILLALSVTGLFVSTVADHKGEKHGGKFDGKSWLGKWESTNHTENLETFVSQLGYPSAEHVTDQKVFQKFWQDGEHFHHKITVPTKNYTLQHKFTLGQPGKATFNNVEFKYLYAELGNDLHVEITVPSKNKTVSDSYHVFQNGTELEKTYKTGDTVAKRWYKKVISCH